MVELMVESYDFDFEFELIEMARYLDTAL